MLPLELGDGFDKINVGGNIDGFIGKGLVIAELLLTFEAEQLLLRSLDFPLRLQAMLLLTLLTLLGTIELADRAMLLVLTPTLFTKRGNMNGGLVV